ncbi:hypothetical protein GIB67_006056 [Kingdonia uniflora]|uniref:J domain-containing protein n=1 Tax=Kingdonia uniflora TaxID=39325 RepID=A0A7J7LPZ6_9MAGN|nr:hypothetical protein GIB67_006056 [Kingdonia uniflora]
MIQTGSYSLSSLDFVDNVVNEKWEQDLIVNYYEPFEDKYPYALDIAGSCDGLILIRSNEITFLWNPATREYKKLSRHCFHGDYTANLGFGYNEISKDYKVVYLVCNPNRDCIHKVHIYSMQNKSWRMIKMTAEYGVKEKYFRYSESGVSLNGIIHWKAYKPSSSTIKSVETILSFDLRDEKFREVSLHGVMTREWRVGVLKGSLCVLEFEFEHGPYTRLVESVIWVMKDYGVNESWNKLFCIETHRSDIYGIDMKMLHTSNDSEVLLKTSNRNLVLYNIKDKKSKELRPSVRLSKEYHPDTTSFPLKAASEKFMKLRDVYNVLSNEETRRFYEYWTLAQEIVSRKAEKLKIKLEDPYEVELKNFKSYG